MRDYEALRSLVVLGGIITVGTGLLMLLANLVALGPMSPRYPVLEAVALMLMFGGIFSWALVSTSWVKQGGTSTQRTKARAPPPWPGLYRLIELGCFLFRRWFSLAHR